MVRNPVAGIRIGREEPFSKGSYIGDVAM